MQAELNEMGVDVTIHAVNEEGYDSGLSTMAALGDLPLLQDTEEDTVWESWDVTFRDVYIVDDDNVLIDTFNLTTYSLSISENYETLKAMFVAASEG
jgi:hypothetical protein